MSQTPTAWERQRGLGILFLGAVVALFCCVLLIEKAPRLAEMIGIVFVGIGLLIALRLFRQKGASKPGRAPVGPLSRDERSRARSKLMKQQD